MPEFFGRFRALIFDVDGTLAETEEVHRRAFNETFDHFGLQWKWESALYRELLKVTGGKERMRHFIDAYAVEDAVVTDEDISQMHRFKTERYAQILAQSGCCLRPGIAELIAAARARGQKLGIATTTSRGNVEALLSSTLGPDATKQFDAIVAGDEVARKKPAPDVYIKALELLGLSGHECLAIEDSRNGLLSASQTGIPVLITPSHYTSDDDFAGAVAVVKNLAEIGETSLGIG